MKLKVHPDDTDELSLPSRSDLAIWAVLALFCTACVALIVQFGP